MISITSKGDYANTYAALRRLGGDKKIDKLDEYGKAGVAALSSATPVDTGKTAKAWRYRIVSTKNRTAIEWYNINVVNGAPIAILLQYGHGTGTGGYIQGIDYVNPAMRPVFDQIASSFWKEVTTWK